MTGKDPLPWTSASLFAAMHSIPQLLEWHLRSTLQSTCTVKCRVYAHEHLLDFDPNMWDGCLLGADNIWWAAITYGHMHSKSTGTVHIPIPSRSEHKKAGWACTTYSDESMQDFRHKMGVGGWADAAQWAFTRHFTVYL